LMWATIATRPGIAFAIGELSTFVSKPSRKHTIAAKRVIPCLKFTKDYHLRYSRRRRGERFELYGFCDASWGCQDDGKSVSGYLFEVKSCIVRCSSKKQTATTLSAAEAEYVGLSYGVQKSLLRNMLCDIGFVQCSPMIIYEDNQSRVAIAKNSMIKSRTKHIKIRYHFTREMIDAIEQDAKVMDSLSCWRSATAFLLYRTHDC